MSESLNAYIIAVAILAALALSIPCLDALARLFRPANRPSAEVRPVRSAPDFSSRKTAARQ